ncbi:MAG TPA: DUF2269 domain-containing protein [Burkholderiales bacterium]|jgi:uncharacterized membrane protein|nr:DUF2269 domain-containing protein [Burkholderiales bacterium]
MEYLIVKWLHVLSSTVLFGTGLGSAFYMFFTNRSTDVRAIAIVCRRVVWADWLFTTPTAILQPATGFYLVYLAHMPLASNWIGWSLGLYALAGACWLPVVWIQIRMAEMAERAVAQGGTLPPLFWRYHRIWTALGVPAFVAFIAIFYLMVVKPA